MITDKYVFFWGGTFSQWCPSTFEIEGVLYNCCEQYMMAQKALLFNDIESHKMIMYATSPRDQKASDARVHDKSKWQGTNWLGEAIMQVREKLKTIKIEM